MESQRGAGTIGVIFWLAVLGTGAWVATRAVPARLAVMQLHDFANEQTRFMAVSYQLEEGKLIQKILAKAKELDVPLTKKNLSLEVVPTHVTLHLRHTVEVDVKIYKFVWDYNESYDHLRM